MPLDHANGEDIGSYGRGTPVDLHKWADTPMFNMACDAAARAFIKAGALLPIEFDRQEIMAMEYPNQGRLVFVFCKHIAGAEKLFPFPVRFDERTIAELRMSGRWPHATH